MQRLTEGMHADFAVIEYNITADCESFSCTITFLSYAVHTIWSASYLCHTFTMVFTSTSPFGIHLFPVCFFFFFSSLKCIFSLLPSCHHHSSSSSSSSFLFLLGYLRLLHVNLNLSNEYKMNINVV